MTNALSRFDYENIDAILDLFLAPKDGEEEEPENISVERPSVEAFIKDLVGKVGEAFKTTELQYSLPNDEADATLLVTEFAVIKAFYEYELDHHAIEKLRTTFNLHPAPTAWLLPVTKTHEERGEGGKKIKVEHTEILPVANPPLNVLQFKKWAVSPTVSGFLKDAANRVRFSDLEDDENIAALVLEGFQLGGYLDRFSKASLDMLNVTMQLAVAAVREELYLCRDKWFQENLELRTDLPPVLNDDTRSVQDEHAAGLWAEAERKRVDRLAKAREKRDKEHAETKKLRAQVFETFATIPGFGPLIAVLTDEKFEVAKALVDTGTATKSWLPESFVTLLKGYSTKASVHEETLIRFAEDYAFTEAEKVKPLRFKTFDDGTKKIGNKDRKPPGETRPNKTTRLHMLNGLEKKKIKALDMVKWLITNKAVTASELGALLLTDAGIKDATWDEIVKALKAPSSDKAA